MISAVTLLIPIISAAEDLNLKMAGLNLKMLVADDQRALGRLPFLLFIITCNVPDAQNIMTWDARIGITCPRRAHAKTKSEVEGEGQIKNNRK